MRSKKLKPGFTTGAAAAAATKAALLYLLNGGCNSVDNVEIRCLNNERISIAVDSLRILNGNSAEAIVIKDAGDDPDVTHKAEIGARVTLIRSDPAKLINIKAGSKLITIRGGEGVGVVTKPGLEVQPGNPAINPGPATMIREVVNTVFFSNSIATDVKPEDTIYSDKQDSNTVGVDIEIFVPKGKELAEKTLNARLGILGGISILGTTGIVRPMSHDAYIATIKSGISVARAMKADTLVFTTGRRSERFGMYLFPEMPEETFIQTGDFFKASLEAAAASAITDTSDNAGSIKSIIIVVFFGKAVKMAMGFPHTHAAKSELTMKTLAQWAEDITSDSSLAQKIASANTARHAFTYIYPDFSPLICHVGNRIVESAMKFSGNCLKIRSIILDFEGNKIFDSDREPMNTNSSV